MVVDCSSYNVTTYIEQKVKEKEKGKKKRRRERKDKKI